MLNIRFIIKTLGMMFILETMFMLLAVAVALFDDERGLTPLLLSSGIMLGCGLLFSIIGFKANEFNVGRREGMLIVTFTWISVSLLGMLPFYLGGYVPSITDAFFETMSGFTTTGSSILTNVEVLPNSILFWRSLTQWQGGIGMIVFTVALLPALGGGAIVMFNAETPGIIHERFLPRIAQVAKRLWYIYVFLTLILTLLLWAGPMTLFDAVNQAMTTMSTGGYSTKNASIAYWNSAYIDYVITIFMCIGATNMSLIYFLINGKFSKLFKNEETTWFYIFTIGTMLLVTGYLVMRNIIPDFGQAFRLASFQVASLISTTGFATANYISWGPFFWNIAIILMLICGCAGSTCGGLKMGRFMILTKNLFNEFKKRTHPHAVVPVCVNGHVLAGEVVYRVLSFAFIYLALVVTGCLVLMLDGVGFEESIGSAFTAMGNVGPGLGSVGPASNFSALPDLSKWVLSFLMMVGRLEIFTVVTLLIPGFWKQ